MGITSPADQIGVLLAFDYILWSDMRVGYSFHYPGIPTVFLRRKSMNQYNQQFDLASELKRRYRSNPKLYNTLIGVAVVLIVVIWILMNSFYSVEANEQALVLRFGKKHAIKSAGLHFKLPFGIDTVKKAQVMEKKKEEFGFRTTMPGVKTMYQQQTPQLKEESRILTGDLNILMVKWVVRYRISDITNYFFSLRDPVATIRDVSESAMRMVVGDSSVDEVLTIGRNRIQMDMQQQMQEKLDGYQSGIKIVNVRLKDVTAPDDVKAAFNAVNTAKQQQSKIINEAEKERNTKLPEAKGKKQRIIEEARGYAQKRVNEAEGNTKRFLDLYGMYQQSPEVTIRRIYLENMEKILKKVGGKYIMQKPAGDVFKLLNLGDLMKQKGR